MFAVFKRDHLNKLHAWRELAGILFLPVTSIWLAGWFILVTDTMVLGSQILTLAVFLGVLLLSYGSLRIIDGSKLPGALRFLGGLVLLTLNIWLGENLLIYHRPLFDFHRILTDMWGSFTGLRSLSAQFWAVIMICFAWSWTLFYIRKPISQDRILSRMVFGLLMFLILIFLWKQISMLTIILALFVYMSFSLCSLSLARIADFNLIREGRRVPFDRGLLAGLAALSILISSLAAGLSLAASRTLITLVLALANGIMVIVRFVVENVIQPVVNGFIYLLRILMNWLFKPGTEFKIPEMDLQQPQTGVLDPMEIEQSSAEVLKKAQPYILVAILLIIVIVVAVLFLIRRNRERLLEMDESEQVPAEEGLWKRLLGSLTKKVQEVLGQSLARIDPRRAAGVLRAARIRWIYHQLELWAGRRGHARSAASTPAEFEQQLAVVWPDSHQDLHVLTDAYQSVRYGELPESEQAVTDVKDAWERMRRQMVTRAVSPHRRRS